MNESVRIKFVHNKYRRPEWGFQGGGGHFFLHTNVLENFETSSPELQGALQ